MAGNGRPAHVTARWISALTAREGGQPAPTGSLPRGSAPLYRVFLTIGMERHVPAVGMEVVGVEVRIALCLPRDANSKPQPPGA